MEIMIDKIMTMFCSMFMFFMGVFFYFSFGFWDRFGFPNVFWNSMHDGCFDVGIIKMNKKDPLAGLNKGLISPYWKYDEEVTIVSGEYAGQTGLLKHCTEVSSSNIQVEVETINGRVWCNLKELGGEPRDSIQMFLLLSEEKIDIIKEMQKRWQEGDYVS